MGTSLKSRLTDAYIAPCGGGEIYLYAVGGLSMSVCAPSHLDGQDVAQAVTRHYPSGLYQGWKIAADAHFKGGQANPCQCEESSDRKHWLLDC